MLMVKPGMPYLDVVREVKDKVSTECRVGEVAPQCTHPKWRGSRRSL